MVELNVLQLPSTAEAAFDRSKESDVGRREHHLPTGAVPDVAHRGRRERAGESGIYAGENRRSYPGRAAVVGVEEPGGADVEGVTKAEEQTVRVDRAHRQRADGQRAQRLGDGVPVRSVRGVDRSGSVERLPDPAAGGGEVDDVRVGRMHEDVAHPPGIDLVEDDSVSLEVGAPGSEVDPSVARSTHGLKRIACAPG